MSYDYWMVLVVCSTFVLDSTLAVDQNEEDPTNEFDDQFANQIEADISALDDGLKYPFSSSPQENAIEPRNLEYDPKIQLRDVFSKRARLYRKYPGKRQNGGYVNDIYDCNPSSKETIRLLYAIHQARLGDIQHIVFCNRLRNPKGIIPNPRYIGKRSISSRGNDVNKND